mmetsp:Transcript_22755/g.53789  ORF Transcript_22755/g.53789 Transcript_22755/m.53789 type:complete len:454 (-) Transcript_22755:137-1498(-)
MEAESESRSGERGRAQRKRVSQVDKQKTPILRRDHAQIRIVGRGSYCRDWRRHLQCSERPEDEVDTRYRVGHQKSLRGHMVPCLRVVLPEHANCARLLRDPRNLQACLHGQGSETEGVELELRVEVEEQHLRPRQHDHQVAVEVDGDLEGRLVELELLGAHDLRRRRKVQRAPLLLRLEQQQPRRHRAHHRVALGQQSRAARLGPRRSMRGWNGRLLDREADAWRWSLGRGGGSRGGSGGGGGGGEQGALHGSCEPFLNLPVQNLHPVLPQLHRRHVGVGHQQTEGLAIREVRVQRFVLVQQARELRFFRQELAAKLRRDQRDRVEECLTLALGMSPRPGGWLFATAVRSDCWSLVCILQAALWFTPRPCARARAVRCVVGGRKHDHKRVEHVLGLSCPTLTERIHAVRKRVPMSRFAQHEGGDILLHVLGKYVLRVVSLKESRNLECILVRP